MNPALITVIEGKGCDNRGSKKSNKRDLEAEAIRCFKSWRNKGGAFKDIPIYCLAPTERLPSKETIRVIENLGVDYIEKFIPETDAYRCGYWNIPLAGVFFEKNLKEDFFIHIDLDMELIKEPSDTFLWCNPETVKVGKFGWHRKINPDFEISFETCFITSWKKNGFYQRWYDILKEEETKFKGTYEYADMEEHVIDIAYHENRFKIEPVKNFQIGPRCRPLYELKDISNIYFYHGHFHEERENYIMRYLTRWKGEYS